MRRFLTFALLVVPLTAGPADAMRPHDGLGRASAAEPVLFPELISAVQQGSPYDLPPEMRLRAGAVDGPVDSAVRRRVLANRSLVLSPSARRNVRSGRASVGALTVLDALPDGAAPFLVHAVGGHRIRVQATSLAETIGAIDDLQTLSSRGSLAELRLIPVAADAYDEGKEYARGERGAAMGERAAQIALKYLGIPYVWGGATPTGGFDCSGLTMYVYAQLGVPLHHFTGLQWLEGERIEAEHLRPGDLVFFRPEGDHPGHEGMYLGSGKFIHAPRTGDVVKISDLAGYAGRYVGAVRPYSGR